MSKLVTEVMSVHPRTVGPDTTIRDAARILEESDVGSVPVVDPTFHLQGMLTDRDIVIRVVAAGLDPATTTVQAVATTNVSTIQDDDPLDDAIEVMAFRRLRRLPVVDQDGKLVGIIAQADVVHEAKDKQAGRLVEEISQPAAADH
jgi:CBS domain-containing protein